MNAEEWDALIAAAPAHAPPYREDFRFVPTHEPRYLTPLSDMPTDPPPPLLLGRLHPIQATILYGPGDAGKGTLAVSWAKQLADTGRRVAILDYEGNDLEWSSRLHGLGGADVLYLAPSRDYPAGRVPHPPAAGGRRYPDMDSMRAAGLAGHVDQLKDELDDAEIDYIIIDSAGMAAPGDPGSPEPVMAYFAALQQLRRPSLTIAHTNRAGDSRYPFGSVYWHALSRLSWSLIPEGDDSAKLQNRKHNNYAWQGAYMFSPTYRNDVLREVWERPYGVTLAERISEVLLDGPATLDDILAALAADGTGEAPKRNSISHALRRGLSTIPKPWTVNEDSWSSTSAGIGTGTE